jgi:hypothetical protein
VSDLDSGLPRLVDVVSGLGHPPRRSSSVGPLFLLAAFLVVVRPNILLVTTGPNILLVTSRSTLGHGLFESFVAEAARPGHHSVSLLYPQSVHVSARPPGS